MRIELLGRAQHAEHAPVRDRERADDLEVVRLLDRGEPIEPETVSGKLGRLSAVQRGFGLHRPGVRSHHAERDDQDAQVHHEAAVAAVVPQKEPAHRRQERLAHAEPRAGGAREVDHDRGRDEDGRRERERRQQRPDTQRERGGRRDDPERDGPEEVALEAFKGDQVDWRFENSAKEWANSYDFPAVRDKRVVREEFPTRNIGVMQAFVFNIRRDKFKDPRVRRAFNFVFDFEEMNRQLFFGQYKRIASFFEGTELAATGVPSGKELEILETVRGKVPDELFTKPYTNPVGGNPEAVRGNLREALRLFREAGYELKDTRLVDAKSGKQFAVEFLVDEPAAERFVLFYKPSLDRLGMTVSVRVVDAAQYENRLRQWDFDIIVASWAQSLSPGNEQRGFWSSQAADQPGSRNLIGIRNPAVDSLIERVIFTKDREDLVAATRALDRVLLWNFYVVPQWTYGKQRTARWDRFGRPETMPKYGASAFPTIWWWDAARAAKVPQRS